MHCGRILFLGKIEFVHLVDIVVGNKLVLYVVIVLHNVEGIVSGGLSTLYIGPRWRGVGVWGVYPC